MSYRILFYSPSSNHWKLEPLTNETTYSFVVVGRGCHSLRSLLRDSEASLPLVESRIRERVPEEHRLPSRSLSYKSSEEWRLPDERLYEL